MRWILLITALIALSAIWMLRPDAESEERLQARSYLIGLGNQLARFAEQNGGRYPIDLEELQLITRSAHAKHAIDPWGRPYLYERHGRDPQLCRALTLGPDGVPSREGDELELVLYRLGQRSLWREGALNAPSDW